VFIDRKTFVRHYQDDSVDIFRVYLKPGQSPQACGSKSSIRWEAAAVSS